MLVRAISTKLSDEDAEIVGYAKHLSRTNFKITVDRTYIVYEVNWLVSSNVYEKVMLFRILNDCDVLVPIPSMLFTIEDGSLPSIWQFYAGRNSCSLSPPAFMEKYFIDDYTDGEPDAVRRFNEIKANIDLEAGKKF